MQITWKQVRWEELGFLLVLLFAPHAFSQDAATVQRAASAVTTLRGMMKDPESFVLESVTLQKPNKKGESNICYFFRAHNSYGGYGGTAEATLNSKGIVKVITAAAGRGGMLDAMEDPCKPKLRTADITAEVLASLKPAAPVAK